MRVFGIGYLLQNGMRVYEENFLNQQVYNAQTFSFEEDLSEKISKTRN